MPRPIRIDNDTGKGAFEEGWGLRPRGGDFHGQLGHRDQDEMLKEADSDFPEPGSNPEHSGQHS